MATKVFNRAYLYEVKRKVFRSPSKSLTYNKLIKISKLVKRVDKNVFIQPYPTVGQKLLTASVPSSKGLKRSFKKWIEPVVWNSMNAVNRSRHLAKVKQYSGNFKTLRPADHKIRPNLVVKKVPYYRLFDSLARLRKIRAFFLPSFKFYLYKKSGLNWQKAVLRIIQLYRPNQRVLWYKAPNPPNIVNFKKHVLAKIIASSRGYFGWNNVIVRPKNFAPRYWRLIKFSHNFNTVLRFILPSRRGALFSLSSKQNSLKIVKQARRRLLVYDDRDRFLKLVRIVKNFKKKILFTQIPAISRVDSLLLLFYMKSLISPADMRYLRPKSGIRRIRPKISIKRRNQLINALRKAVELKSNPTSISFPKVEWNGLPGTLKKRIKIKNNLVKRYWSWRSSGLLSCRASRWISPALWRRTTRLQKNIFKKWSSRIFKTKKTGVHISPDKSRRIYLRIAKNLLANRPRRFRVKIKRKVQSRSTFVHLSFKKKKWKNFYSWQRQSNRLLWWAMYRDQRLQPDSETDKMLGRSAGVYPKRALNPIAPKVSAPKNWRDHWKPLLDKMKKNHQQVKSSRSINKKMDKKKLGNRVGIYLRRALNPIAPKVSAPKNWRDHWKPLLDKMKKNHQQVKSPRS